MVMAYGNCLYYALWKRITTGQGRIIKGKSGHRRICRYYWEDPEGNLWYFKPKHPKQGWLAYLHLICYQGMVRCERRKV